MKRILFLLIASLALPLFAQENLSPHISVFGTATTEVVPNEMSWFLHLENKGTDLEAVATDHSKIIAAVLAFLKDAGISLKTIQNSRMSFGENWQYENNQCVLKGYAASTTIVFKLGDFSLYQKLWTGLARISGVSVENVTYDHTSRATYQNETRQKALLIAREKARSMAAVLGAEVGEPLVIEDQQVNEDQVVFAGMPARFAPASGGSSQDVLAPGTIPIKMTVHATFKLEPRSK
jgi:uncharacterized protein YggE